MHVLYKYYVNSFSRYTILSCIVLILPHHMHFSRYSILPKGTLSIQELLYIPND